MRPTTWSRFGLAMRAPANPGATPGVVLALLAAFLLARPAEAADLKVMRTGLGSGTVTSNPPGTNCGTTCDATFAADVSVTLTAAADAGSKFSHWEGDATGTANPVTMNMSQDRSVRAVFVLDPPLPPLTDFTPMGIQTYLTANPRVNTAARFVNALPAEFKRNWILMTRSESLQTGTAEFPRILMPSANAQAVFTVGLSQHSSYPGAHPNAIEYMQWDAAQKNFRFHEIVLADIPEMGNIINLPDGTPTGRFPPRPRGVATDDFKCSKCHSTRNVLNLTPFPGTTGVPPGVVKDKNKPNWDPYDSWGGMLPFNRDRIYQGSVEAAAFRKILNLWTWRANEPVRAVIEQLELQPPGVTADDAITRVSGGRHDGHIRFAFDPPDPPVLVEPVPTGSSAPITTAYAFNGLPGAGAATNVIRGGPSVLLRHTSDVSSPPAGAEGRGVQLFDLLGGLDGSLNQQRIADEVASHRWATGSVPIDVRPIALAISRGLVTRNAAANTVTSTFPFTVDLSFFNARNGMSINELFADTQTKSSGVLAAQSRTQSIPRRKADIQKLNLDRTGDIYLKTSAGPVNGLIQQYGTATAAGLDTSLARLRQEVFRRPIDLGDADATVMGGIYVDREFYSNTEKVALYRYFLEPLGVSVDKWSMAVRGRSRTYAFADVFGSYENTLIGELRASLLDDPIDGLMDPNDDAQVMAAVNTTLGALPPVGGVPTYTDVQRIFNKSCIECHGGLNYPPYANYGFVLDLSEEENPTPVSPPLTSPRLARSYNSALSYTTPSPATSLIYQKITKASEACPDFANGLMPCGGPELSMADIKTIERWITGGRPGTVGDPHIQTIDGVNYDFQAAGEFVFLRDEGLEIQVRQTAVATDVPLGPDPHTGLTSCVSVNSAVAVRVGRDRITYQPNLSGEPDPESLQLRVDGKLVKLGPDGIPLPSGGRIIPTIAAGGIQIEAPGGAVIVITPGWWEHFQVWFMNIDTRHVRATQGLAGSIAPGNWLPALPDGKLLGPRPANLEQRRKDLYETFGKAWRVTDKTSLFDYAPGTSTKTFTIEGWPGGEPAKGCKPPPGPGGTGTKPPLKPMPLEVARKLAADIADKVQREHAINDMMATGDPVFAKVYLLADQIRRNAAPAAPALAAPEPGAAKAPGTVAFRWSKSTDRDGDPVAYRHYVWPVDEQPSPTRAVLVSKQNSKEDAKSVSRVVSGLKPGRAYYWKVVAEDGKGGTVESETRRFEINN